MSQADLAHLVERLEKVAVRLERAAAGSAPSSSSALEETAAFVKEYDVLINGPLAEFCSSCEKIGGLVSEQAVLLKKAFCAQKQFLVVASKSKKPADQGLLIDLLKPTSENLAAIMDIKEKNRRSEWFNHLAALGEGVAALGWVTVEPAPSPFVKEMADAGTFYINRVLKDFKEKGDAHSVWARSLQAIWRDLQAYVKTHHTTGLSWNIQGGDAKSVAAAVASGTAAPAPPPPPPPAGLAPPAPPAPGAMLPPPLPVSISVSAGSSAAPDASALFAELNKGSDITKGLKKVTDDLKTHKNPALRAGPAPYKPPTAPKPSSPSPSRKAVATEPIKAKSPEPAKTHATSSSKLSAPASQAKIHPPLVELQGKKWVAEYVADKHDVVIDDTDIKQTVYLYKCCNATVVIKGKVNSVTLDSCKKTGVVLDDAISMVEFVNCQSVKAQVIGKVPTVSIEKTDGCQVFLSRDSIDTSFISAKSSEMNVVIPTADGDYNEYAIAEQFRTKFNGTRLVTEVNDIAA